MVLSSKLGISTVMILFQILVLFLVWLYSARRPITPTVIVSFTIWILTWKCCSRTRSFDSFAQPVVKQVWMVERAYLCFFSQMVSLRTSGSLLRVISGQIGASLGSTHDYLRNFTRFTCLCSCACLSCLCFNIGSRLCCVSSSNLLWMLEATLGRGYRWLASSKLRGLKFLDVY